MKKRLVVITRPQDEGQEFQQLLLQRNCASSLVPLISCEPRSLTSHDEELLQLLAHADFSVICFTSPRGVRYLADALQKRGLASPFSVAFAAQGVRTGNEVLSFFGRSPEFIPEIPVAEDLGVFLSTKLPQESRVLLVRSEQSRGILAPMLREAGLVVTELELYRTCAVTMDDLTPTMRATLFAAGALITFFSPSAVRALLAMAHEILTPQRYADWKNSARFVAFGPITAEALKEGDCTPAFVHVVGDVALFAQQVAELAR
jgi:uroporphyrinogen-III synthase